MPLGLSDALKILPDFISVLELRERWLADPRVGRAPDLRTSLGGAPRRNSHRGVAFMTASAGWITAAADVARSDYLGNAVPMRAVSKGANTTMPFWKVFCQDAPKPRNVDKSSRRLSGDEMSSTSG
jgi:hypothetical protein